MIKKIAELSQKIIKSEFISNERKDMMSLRVKLTWLTFLTWCTVIYMTAKIIRKVFRLCPPEKVIELGPIMMDKVIIVFSYVTTVLLIFIIVYLLGKQSFKIKLGPVELSLGNGQSQNVDVQNGVPNGISNDKPDNPDTKPTDIDQAD